MSANIKTFANLVQAAITADATISAYCTHILNVDMKEDEDIFDVIKRHIGDKKYMIFVTNARIEDKEDYGSSNTSIYRLQCDIYSVIQSGVNFDVDNLETKPVMGTPPEGQAIEDVAEDIDTLLDNNKLSNYVELGGEIIASESALDLGTGLHAVLQTYEGKRKA